MSNYNSTLQSNNTDLQAILNTINELPEAGGSGEQATPVISVNNSNGLITAVAGTKTSTHQLAFQPAKTITPSTTSQIAVSSGYYTGGNITVAAVPTQSKTVTPTSTSQNVAPDSGKFLSKVTVVGDANLVAGNIKSGVSIFGVSGNYVGSGDTSMEDAMVTRTLSVYSNDRITNIGNYVFYNYSNLTSLSFPKVTSIGDYAFYYCSRLASLSFPMATNIGSSAFCNCSSLTSVSFPKVTSMGYNAFGYCPSLTSVSFPEGTSIGSNAFYRCSNLTSLSFPKVTSIGTTAFAYCSRLASLSFPKVTSIGGHAFAYCSSLTSVSFPKVTSIGSNAFAYCSRLASLSFPMATNIGSSAFCNCSSLTSIYLMNSAVCTLANSNVFAYTSIRSNKGSIFVPTSLVASYKKATNWTFFSNRICSM